MCSCLNGSPYHLAQSHSQAREAQQVVTTQIKKKHPLFPIPHPTNPSLPSPPLKIHKLTRDEMVKHQLKGLCYNCDDKYFPGHKCKENKLFMAIFKDISEDDGDALPQEPLPQPDDDIPPSDQPMWNPKSPYMP
jgi:hypothetical protein